MREKLKNLPGLSTQLRNCLEVGDLSELELRDLTSRKSSYGRLLRPSELMQRIQGVGEKRIFEFVDALVGYAVSLEDKLANATEPARGEVSPHAVQIVCSLVHRTTGDVGGRDQARLFAQIAHDYLDALRAERAARA